MGEAKQRQRRLERLLAECPNCVFCGGAAPADSVDHVPPIALFRQRHRPRGLEFPACTPCNRNTSKFEVIANAFGRIQFGEVDEIEQEEFAVFLGDAEVNNPGFFAEIGISRMPDEDLSKYGLPSGSGTFNTGGPIVASALNKFAAKVGMALHFSTTKRIVPIEGAALVRIYTNQNQLEGHIPDSLMSILGEPQTLRMGKFNVGSRFMYSSAVSDTKRAGIYFATFSFAFATLSYVVEDASNLPEMPGWYVARPGFITDDAKFIQLPDMDEAATSC